MRLFGYSDSLPRALREIPPRRTLGLLRCKWGKVMRLGDFRVLSFDCYGTLIDWESGIWTALQPLVVKASDPPDREAALAAFGRHESDLEAGTPGLLYSELLTRLHSRLAAEWGVAADPEADRRFGASVGDWPAFPDSPEALAYLKRFYKLVILSNVDRASFARSNLRLGVEFDAICTAEDIGAYKPDPRNFRYLLDRVGTLGYRPEELLHVAQSLYHDHLPANRVGLHSAWIDRRQGQEGGATPAVPDEVRYDFRFGSLAEVAAAHRAEQGG